MILAQCAHDFTANYGLQLSMFLAGLVGGATHCSWMCGSFVIAQGRAERGRLNSVLLLPYHLGRMTTYVLMAIALSAFLNLGFVYSHLKGLLAVPMLLTAAVVFIVVAFPQLSSFFPWALKLRIPVVSSWAFKGASVLMSKPGGLPRYILGVLLGFMPCGLVVSALLASATAPDVWRSAMAMAFFSLGTVPSLVVVALGGHVLGRKYPLAGEYVRKSGMVLSSLWLMTLAGFLVYENGF